MSAAKEHTGAPSSQAIVDFHLSTEILPVDLKPSGQGGNSLTAATQAVGSTIKGDRLEVLIVHPDLDTSATSTELWDFQKSVMSTDCNTKEFEGFCTPYGHNDDTEHSYLETKGTVITLEMAMPEHAPAVRKYLVDKASHFVNPYPFSLRTTSFTGEDGSTHTVDLWEIVSGGLSAAPVEPTKPSAAA